MKTVRLLYSLKVDSQNIDGDENKLIGIQWPVTRRKLDSTSGDGLGQREHLHLVHRLVPHCEPRSAGPGNPATRVVHQTLIAPLRMELVGYHDQAIRYA